MVSYYATAGTNEASKVKSFYPDRYPKYPSDINDLMLVPDQKVALLHLMTRANKDGMCFPSLKEAGETCFRNGSSMFSKPESLAARFRRAAKGLVGLGLITKGLRRRADGSSLTNVYQLTKMSEWPVPTLEQTVNMPWPIARRVKRQLLDAGIISQQEVDVSQLDSPFSYTSQNHGVIERSGGGDRAVTHNFIISNLDLIKENNKAGDHPRLGFLGSEKEEEEIASRLSEMDRRAEQLMAMTSRRSEPEQVSNLGITASELETFESEEEFAPIPEVDWDKVKRQNDKWMEEEIAKVTAPVNSSAFSEPKPEPIEPEENNKKSKQPTPVSEFKSEPHPAQEPLNAAQDQDCARAFFATKENNTPQSSKPKPKLKKHRFEVNSKPKPKPVLRTLDRLPRFIGEVLRKLQVAASGFSQLPMDNLYKMPRFLAVRRCQMWLIKKLAGYVPFLLDDEGNIVHVGRETVVDLEETMGDYGGECGLEDLVFARNSAAALRILRNTAIKFKVISKQQFNDALTRFFVEAQEFLKQGGSYDEFLKKPLPVLFGDVY